MFIQYSNPGTCRICNDEAYSHGAFICAECARIANNERMQRRYDENIKNGYTANGDERKQRPRKYVTKKIDK